MNTAVRLAELTTARVGGSAKHYIEARTEAEIIDAVQGADSVGEPLLIIGGGSNLIISDAGYDGTVLRIASGGYTLESEDSCGGVFLQVQAGHPWDELVDETVRHGWSGLEALSGIPGLTGATPVQNVGAYGAEVSQTIASIRTWDRQQGSVRTFTNSELQFSYRNSLLKETTVEGSPRFVVLTVQFQLAIGRMSAPVRYAELARILGVEVGGRANAVQTREVVLQLRAAKGMVLDPQDRDTYSTGSFFTNPIVDAAVAASLPDTAPRYPVGPAEDGKVKLSAAWLIDQAGFGKGFGLGQDAEQNAGKDTGQDAEQSLAGGRAALSTKHTLAVTNRGGASAQDLLTVARAVRDGVEARFGIRLVPEPLLIGCSL